MQRKNSVLRTNPRKKRSGFAIIMAIAVIVVISTIMALSISLTTETTKRTVDLYLYEQAELVAKSAVELTLLEIAKRDPVTNCLNTYDALPFDANITTLFDVNVSLQYFFTGAVGGCTPFSPGGVATYVTTDEQNGSVLMDVVVSTKPDITTEPIRYFRRTIQKL